MTDRERYKRAFSVLHAPEELKLEENGMKNTTKRHISKAAAIGAAILAVCMGSAAAYAADIGGIQHQVQIWLHGGQTDAVLTIEQNDHTEYSLTYEDENGEQHEIQGGGVSYDIFGNEQPLTEEDIMRDVLDNPEVVYNDDGTVYVYYREQKIDITDKFDENGKCCIRINAGDQDLYMKIEPDGYSVSSDIDGEDHNVYIMVDSDDAP